MTCVYSRLVFNSFTFFILSTCSVLFTFSNELWKKDLTEEMKIGLATTGYEKVQLRCGANSMQVDITLSGDNDQVQGESDFQGVIYTRGSFHRKQPPCYINGDDPKSRSNNGRSYTLKFPLNKCQTLHNGDTYSNVVVVQYDKDLIMPGDAAFNVECDFSKPRDVTVNADLNGKVQKAAASRISLIDADPGHHSISLRQKRSVVENNTDFVEFTLADAQRSKINDEL